MKFFNYFIFLYFLYSKQFFSLAISLRWPTEKTAPSKKLPSLEVRVAPPQEYQPKVQAEIKILDTNRETTEYKLLESLEKKYNEELINAGRKFQGVIDKALKIFDNPELLKQSIQSASNPPSLASSGSKKKIIGFFFKERNKNLTNSINKSEEIHSELINEDHSSKIFRSEEILVKNNNLEKNSQDNNTNDKDLENIQEIPDVLDVNINKTIRNSQEPKNNIGFLSISENIHLKDRSKEKQGGDNNDGVPLPPILVKIYDAKEPDQKVQTEMDKLEKERIDYEKKMFAKAEQELKLITAQTVQELQSNLESELMPFFVASKNVINDITSTLSKSMSSLKLFRFAEKHENEMRSYFPIFMHEYDQKKDNLTLNLDSNDFISNTSEKTIIESPRFIEDNNDKDEDLNNLTNDNINNDPNDISSIDKYELKENLNKNKTVYAISNVLSPEICEDLWKKYPYLDFGCDRIPVSFLQIKSKLRLKSKQASDNVNVKVGASETSYPTVYRLIYEMENRRDLAEKWERLKILEFEMNLQKAEDEMIKDALHQGLAKVLAKFGPAIEGVQENIR